MKEEISAIEQVSKAKAMIMSAEIINGLNEAKKQLKIDLEKLNALTGFSKGYLSQMLKSTSCPMTTACTLAHALGYELKLVKKSDDEK